MIRSRGADHVIDYTTQDFTSAGSRYDVIFDNVENRSLSDCRRALTPTGTLILNSGTGAQGIGMLVRLLKPLVLSPFVQQNLRRYLSVANHKDLVVLKELVESGRLTPVVDRTHPLHETAEALRYIEAGHARGKSSSLSDAWPCGLGGTYGTSLLCSRGMTEAGLAVFVLVGFLLPIPILTWLDRPVTRRQGG